MTDPGADWLASLRERREQQYKQHIDRLTFRVTLASTIIALLAALAAFWSGYEAHQARIDDERPFLAVDVTLPTADDKIWIPVFGSPKFIRTKITAFGKTPARNVDVTCESYPALLGDKVIWPVDKVEGDPTTKFPFILPSRTVQVSCPYAKSIPESERGIVISQYGVAQYQDDSNTTYQTPFCVVAVQDEADPRVTQCPKSNGLPNLR
jgi:hypothetical protein